MAIRYAVATGNWSDPLIWNGGTLPTSNDDVYANTFTVTIDQDVTVLSIQTGTTTGVTVGGLFTCSTSRNIIATSATGIKNGSGTTACLSITGGSVNIYSNINGSTTGTAPPTTLDISGNATVNVYGAVTGGSTGASAINVSGSASTSITGNIIGASGTNKYGVLYSTTGSISIVGSISAGTGSTAHGVIISTSTPTSVTITGNITGGNNSAHGVVCQVATSVVVTGNINASTSGSGINLTNGTVTSVGTITASSTFPGIISSQTTLSGLITATGPFISSSVGSTFPVYAYKFKIKANQTNSWLAWRDDSSANGTEVRWQTSDLAGGNPVASNVRLGTIFGASNEFVGTLAVPPASSVASGVPVGNTVGTAAVKLEDIAAVTGAQIVAALSRE